MTAFTNTIKDIQPTELIEQFRKGKENAFKQIFETHYGAILHYAQHFLEKRAEAEDIAQEVFVMLWKARMDIQTPEHLKSFLYKSTRFACINQLRQWQSKTKQAEVLLERALNDSFSDSRLVQEEILQAVIIEIRSLPDKYARILQLKYIEGLDYDEISKRLNLPEATIRKQRQRAVEMLRTIVVKKQLLTAAGLLTILKQLHL